MGKMFESVFRARPSTNLLVFLTVVVWSRSLRDLRSVKIMKKDSGYRRRP